jgi:predicted regulator of Ras-like GTPase activity (Roadblock/LC7/MglB family)
MARGNRETVCQKCGFPIPAISFKQEPAAPKPSQPVASQPAKLTEFTDQPSPFVAVPRESKPPSGQKPTFIPFSASAGSRPAAAPAKPFVQQSPVPQPKPAHAPQVIPRAPEPAPEEELVEVQPPAQARPKNLSSISALQKPGRAIPSVNIPSHDAIGEDSPRPVSPAPVLSVEGSKPSGNLSNPLNLKNRPPSGSPAVESTRPLPEKRAAPAPQPGPPTGGKDSLEKTMKRELESFKEKIDLLPKAPVVAKKEEPAAEKVDLSFKEPENLGDVLRELIKFDPSIKASALVKRDGTILASAISSTLSDSLIAIIATTVTTVGSDIMFATEAGDLKYITFGGTSGIVHIVPTIGDIFLIILTGSNSKQGIISVVAKHVEKGVKTYLNL